MTAKLKPHETHEVCALLAAGELTQTAIAARYGIHQSRVSQIAKLHARRIDAMRAEADNELAGLWITSKAKRLATLQCDVEDLQGNCTVESKRARAAILRAAAEELGQLPARVTVTVTPVTHILKNVDASWLE